ncbi:MAG TPA: hypothetical protein DCF73_18110, partial [Rhodobiaceae bacterium]|nr:hypothetical protein [Rhodobiaceae bacterium]
MDPLSDVLRSMRLTGGIFLEAEFTAPWAIVSRVEPEDCAPFGQMPRNIVAYHYVEEGELRLNLENGLGGAAPRRGGGAGGEGGVGGAPGPPPRGLAGGRG